MLGPDANGIYAFKKYGRGYRAKRVKPAGNANVISRYRTSLRLYQLVPKGSTEATGSVFWAERMQGSTQYQISQFFKPAYANKLLKYVANGKANLVRPPPPAICDGQVLDLRDTSASSCFVRGMQERLQPKLDAVARDKAAGVDACTAGSKGTQPHQQSVIEVAGAMAKRTPAQMNGQRGLLVFHNTGSGKTITSLGIMLKFWNTKRHILLATTVGNKSDNNPLKYLTNLLTIFPEEARAIVFPGMTLPRPDDAAGIKAFVDNKDNVAKFSKRFKFYTFTTLASELKDGPWARIKGDGWGQDKPEGLKKLINRGKGSVLILDEVQSLFTPDRYLDACEFLVGYSARGYKPKFPGHTPCLLDPKVAPHMYVFALTATPGNKPDDILKVLNFVRPLQGPAYTTSVPAFTAADVATPSKFAGLVSYVDIRSDTSRYATKQVRNVFITMDPKYYAAFLRVVAAGGGLGPHQLAYPGQAAAAAPAKNAKAGKAAGGNANAGGKARGVPKEMKFLLKQRSAGDSVPAGKTWSPQELAAKKKDRVPGVVTINSNQTRVLSPKLVEAINNMIRMPGKQYAYVADANTLKVLKAALKAMKFEEVTPGDFHGLTAKEHMWTNKDRFITYKGGGFDNVQRDDKTLKAFVDYFDDEKARRNLNGEKCKLLLATETFYQGVDLKALRGVHLIDALFNQTSDMQAVGRALRLCGHSGAPDKNVKVFRYFAVPPTKFEPEDAGVKGAGAQSLKALHRIMRSMPSPNMYQGIVLPEGTKADELAKNPGVNSYVHAMGACMQQPVTAFELGLKAFAIDCNLFKSVYHADQQFTCGKAPSTAANASMCVLKPFKRTNANVKANGNKASANGPATPTSANRPAPGRIGTVTGTSRVGTSANNRSSAGIRITTSTGGRIGSGGGSIGKRTRIKKRIVMSKPGVPARVGNRKHSTAAHSAATHSAAAHVSTAAAHAAVNAHRPNHKPNTHHTAHHNAHRPNHKPANHKPGTHHTAHHNAHRPNHKPANHKPGTHHTAHHNAHRPNHKPAHHGAAHRPTNAHHGATRHGNAPHPSTLRASYPVKKPRRGTAAAPAASAFALYQQAVTNAAAKRVHANSHPRPSAPPMRVMSSRPSMSSSRPSAPPMPAHMMASRPSMTSPRPSAPPMPTHMLMPRPSKGPTRPNRPPTSAPSAPSSFYPQVYPIRMANAPPSSRAPGPPVPKSAGAFMSRLFR